MSEKTDAKVQAVLWSVLAVLNLLASYYAASHGLLTAVPTWISAGFIGYKMGGAFRAMSGDDNAEE